MREQRPIPVVGGNHPDFIARPEYRLLENQVRDGHNPILITGPYGSGKTALVQRYVDKHTKRGARWLVATNTLSGTGVLSQALLDASREKVRTLIIDEADSL